MNQKPMNMIKLTITAVLWSIISRPLFSSNLDYFVSGMLFGAFLGYAHYKWGIMA